MARITGQLTSNVASAAGVEMSSSALVSAGGIDTNNSSSLAFLDGYSAPEETGTEITLRDGRPPIVREGPDGRTSIVTARDDGTLHVVHVDEEGNVVRAQAQVTGDGDGGWSINDWHFEGRDELNTDLPESVDDIQDGDGWTELTPAQSAFHDDPATPDPERKFIHEDGREAVFNPETGELVTDPRYAGTYNYVNPAPVPEDAWDLGGWADWTFSGIGHVITDVIPYFFGGNVRGPDPAPGNNTGNGGGGSSDSDGGGGYSNSLTEADEGPEVCGSCSDGGGGGYDNPDLDGHPSAAG